MKVKQSVVVANSISLFTNNS